MTRKKAAPRKASSGYMADINETTLGAISATSLYVTRAHGHGENILRTGDVLANIASGAVTTPVLWMTAEAADRLTDDERQVLKAKKVQVQVVRTDRFATRSSLSLQQD